MEDCLATVEPTVVITATPEVVAPVAAPVAVPVVAPVVSPVTVNVPPAQIIYVPAYHTTTTVTATRAQVRKATPHKRVGCPVTPLQQACPVTREK